MTGYDNKYFSMNLHLKLFDRFNRLWYVYDKYLQRPKEVCNPFGLQESSTLLFNK